MNDELFRMMEIGQQGFYCSQILLMMGLEAQGKTNPDLVRAMAGLAGGLGFCGKNCGSLTGGASLLSLYTGRGAVEEVEDSRSNEMIRELVDWFEREVGALYGGIDCQNILDDDPRNRMERCPQIVARTYQKVKEILTKNGYDLSGKLVES